MSVMQSEVFEAFRAIDIPEDKALKAAAALSKRDDEILPVKSELLDHDAFRSNRSESMNVIDSNEIDHDVVRKPVPTFRHHALVIKWMMGFVLAFQVAIFGKMFMH